MKKYVIDGLFLTQRITGTQRYAYELVSELDKIADKNCIEILVPLALETVPEYRNIKVVKYGKNHGIKWQQVDLCRYLKKNKYEGIFLNNVLPIFYRKGFITIHDVCYKANPKFYKSFRDKISMMWHRLNYFMAVHSDIAIITDSEFSKNEIMKNYKVANDKINIIYCGWQHINRVKTSSDTFIKYPMLTPNDYYFSMSTLGANKNFKWILYAAKNNPDKTFAIAGGGKLKGAAEAAGFTNLPNIHFLGYVSDEDAKTLMANCKAFLFPTLYEGFGIPPLEAVACGCKQIVVSDTPCMREIYGDYAVYINQDDYDNAVIPQFVSTDMTGLLDKYSWVKSSEHFNILLKNDAL